jgi:hypothetical protein
VEDPCGRLTMNELMHHEFERNTVRGKAVADAGRVKEIQSRVRPGITVDEWFYGICTEIVRDAQQLV